MRGENDQNAPCFFMRKIYQLDCLLCEKLPESLVFCSWLVKVAFFVGQISNARIAFILGWREYGDGVLTLA
jgi:hypothetical protein